jgi:hypothetical protein
MIRKIARVFGSVILGYSAFINVQFILVGLFKPSENSETYVVGSSVLLLVVGLLWWGLWVLTSPRKPAKA